MQVNAALEMTAIIQYLRVVNLSDVRIEIYFVCTALVIRMREQIRTSRCRFIILINSSHLCHKLSRANETNEAIKQKAIKQLAVFIC